MIQRLQSLYLAISSLGLFCLYFLPIAKFNSLKEYVFFLYGVKVAGGEFIEGEYTKFIILLILNAIIVLLLVFVIFQFKKRYVQIKLVRLAILLTTIFIAIIFFYYTEKISLQLMSKTEYTFYSAIPILSLLLQILALGAIYKDDRLVKSADRLR